MKLRPFTYLLAVAFVSLAYLRIYDVMELKTAREEEHKSWELYKKIEVQRHSMIRYLNYEMNKPKTYFRDRLGVKYRIRKPIVMEYPAIIITNYGPVLFSPEFTKSFVRLHDLAHKTERTGR